MYCDITSVNFLLNLKQNKNMDYIPMHMEVYKVQGCIDNKPECVKDYQKTSDSIKILDFDLLYRKKTWLFCCKAAFQQFASLIFRI